MLTPAHSLQLTALASLLLLAACGNHRESSDERTTPPIWEPGHWSVVEVHVMDSTLPDPPTYHIGDSVTFDLDQLIAEYRGTTQQSLSRAAIEARLGFELDEYVNHSPGPLSVELRLVADRRGHPEGFRLDYALQVHAGDFGLPPVAAEDWVLEHPDTGRMAWRTMYSLAASGRPTGD